MTERRRTLVVGVGSDFGDDRVGLYVIDLLATRLPACCDLRKVRTAGDLLDRMERVEELHVVDACRRAGPPGTIICGGVRSDRFSGVCFRGTHDLDVVSALRLADSLHQLPPRTVIWGVEAANDGRSSLLLAPLTAEVAAGADLLVKRIVAELRAAAFQCAEPCQDA